MYALAYVSQATVPFDDAAISELADKASTKNARLKVTGYLNYHADRKNFFQVLEGPKEAVLGLMDEISGDQRHRLLNVVHLGETEGRMFPSWNMRYLNTPYFRSIEMEDVLEGVLLTMQEKVFDREKVIDTVMRITRQIASRKSA